MYTLPDHTHHVTIPVSLLLLEESRSQTQGVLRLLQSRYMTFGAHSHKKLLNVSVLAYIVNDVLTDYLGEQKNM